MAGTHVSVDVPTPTPIWDPGQQRMAPFPAVADIGGELHLAAAARPLPSDGATDDLVAASAKGARAAGPAGADLPPARAALASRLALGPTVLARAAWQHFSCDSSGSGSNTAGSPLRYPVTDCQLPSWGCSADGRQRADEVDFGHAIAFDDARDARTRSPRLLLLEERSCQAVPGSLMVSRRLYIASRASPHPSCRGTCASHHERTHRSCRPSNAASRVRDRVRDR